MARSMVIGVMLMVALVGAVAIIADNPTGYVVSEYPPEIEGRYIFCTESEYGQEIEIDTAQVSVDTLKRTFGCDSFNREKTARCRYDQNYFDVKCKNGEVMFEFSK